MKTVCVLFGGVSSEHDVSCISAASVLRNLSADRWNVVMVGISQNGRWLRYTGDIGLIEEGKWETPAHTSPAFLSPDRSHKGLVELSAGGARVTPVDVVFPVLHGKNGEDGTVQGLCELAGIPCVGAGMLSSAVCMDKAVAHILLENAGVPKTKLIALRQRDLADITEWERRLSAELGYPMFVKPANAGSSVGVNKARDAKELEEALQIAFMHDNKAVVEQAVTGREVECSVMGNDTPLAADILGEIAPTAGFYDYSAKYLDDTAELHIPARIPGDVCRRVRDIAVRAYKALDCRGFARVDFFVKEDGEVLLNEINTIPGFTAISMYPKLWEASGLSYPQLLNSLLQYALQG